MALGNKFHPDIITINELRAENGLKPVAWNKKHWLAMRWAPTNAQESTGKEVKSGAGQ